MWEGGSLAEFGEADAYGHRHKVNVGEALAAEIRARTGIETVSSELTYDLRSGEADSLDQMVAMTFANVAMDLIAEGQRGRMVAIRDGHYAHTTMPDPQPRTAQGRRRAAVRRRAVPADLLGQARRAAAPARDAEPGPGLTRAVPGGGRKGRSVGQAGRGRGATRATAEMSSSAWPAATSAPLDLGAQAGHRQVGAELVGEGETDPEVLEMERDLEPERVVVGDHPPAAVGEDPALGGAARRAPRRPARRRARPSGRGRSPRRRRGRSRPGSPG